jgi:hypothetical protein
MQRKTPSYKITLQYLVRDFFVAASFTLPTRLCRGGCISTYVPTGPACRQCQLLESRADIGQTDLGSEPGSRRTHHYQEQIV